MAQIIKNRTLANITEFFFIFAYHEKPRTIMTHLSLAFPLRHEFSRQVFSLTPLKEMKRKDSLTQ